jgi:hypothetical protein
MATLHRQQYFDWQSPAELAWAQEADTLVINRSAALETDRIGGAYD